VTADNFIDALANDSNNVHFSRDTIAAHVRLGHAHGYPDCCIRAYLLALPKPGEVAKETRTDREVWLGTVARRRLCPECIAKMQHASGDEGCKKEQNVEVAAAGLREAANNIRNTRNNQPGDAEAEKMAQDFMQKKIDEFIKWRNR
jgi:hypothetical protein